MKKILTSILLICSLNVFSQADDPADGDGTVPVDGGLSLLLAAGAAYAGKSMHRKKTRSMEHKKGQCRNTARQTY